jgi:phage terminase large subunit
MKKVSQIQENLKVQSAHAISKMDEANKYLNFAKKYYKKHGVSGPFDEKFKGDKKAQEKFMEELGKAWADYKKEHNISTAASNKPWDKKK